MKEALMENKAITPDVIYLGGPVAAKLFTVDIPAMNEEAARIAKEMSSFFDYVPGTVTKQITEAANWIIDLATEYANKSRYVKDEPDRIADAQRYINYWVRKRAEYINRNSEIGTRCPSVMITGAANFPTRKKQKQVEAWDANQRDNYISGDDADRKLRYILLQEHAIVSDDPRAIEKLEKKLAGLKEMQQLMKNVNAYYRKHKTLDGCPDISEKLADKISAEMSQRWRVDSAPFESYELSNNNANIHRIEGRIEELKAKVSAPASEDVTGNGWRMFEDVSSARICFEFDDKPDEETRNVLKSNGFRWSPSNSRWQRQNTSNGMYAAKKVSETLA